MREKIKDAAEKYAKEFCADWPKYEIYHAHDLPLFSEKGFEAGANFMLEELSKDREVGEFIEYWITDNTDNSGYTVETKKNSKSFGACNYHHMIEIAALQSANAKIAKLEQELDKIKTQNEFLIQYYNPKSLTFKNMIDTFIDLPKDKQQKLIDLTAVLKGLET